MKRRWKDYLKGGSVVIGIALSAWGIFLTVKNDTQPIAIQARILWMSLFAIFMIVLLLIIALVNQDRAPCYNFGQKAKETPRSEIACLPD